jgi:DNA-directed RNA polymerase subunit RPC12/RpoP
MKVKGDLKCYHCGHISGQLIGESESPLASRLFVPSAGVNKPLPVPGQRYKCTRCGGPVYLDEIEVVKERAYKCVVDPYETRPGRRPGKKVKGKTTIKQPLLPTSTPMHQVCA